MFGTRPSSPGTQKGRGRNPSKFLMIQLNKFTCTKVLIRLLHQSIAKLLRDPDKFARPRTFFEAPNIFETWCGNTSINSIAGEGKAGIRENNYLRRYFDEVLTPHWHAAKLQRPEANNRDSMDPVIIVPGLREDQSWYQVYLFANRWACCQYPLKWLLHLNSGSRPGV